MSSMGCDIGLIGVGTMGGNFVLNMSDHGYSACVYDATTKKVEEFVQDAAAGKNIRAAYTIEKLAGSLRKPRAIILLVPAGKTVDAVLGELIQRLEPGDLVIDGGNSHFSDTDRRSRHLQEKGLLFMGMGISGGESGARHGPSLMPGGPKDGYERVRPILEDTAAQVDGEPCVTYVGAGSAGHYVKMVHNGIEYALMQLIAETYDLLKRGAGLGNDDLHAVFDQWSQGELSAYLIEITARIFLRPDNIVPGVRLIDRILDQAGQKGTGQWTSMEAMNLQVPTPTIDAAVMMRNLSDYRIERAATSQVIPGPAVEFEGDREQFVTQLGNALYSAMVISYAQGMALLGKASVTYGYGVNPEAVAKIWRGGCIIRSALLEHIRKAYRSRPHLPNLIVAPYFSQQLSKRQTDLRAIVKTAAEWGIPAPGFAASLSYLDAYRSGSLPANLIQAQRDYFGAHTFQRVDTPGVFHADWKQE